MDFSVIQAAPEVRAIVQDNSLIRKFFDALYPRNLFRGEAAPIHQPGQSGDRFIFTGTGLMDVSPEPLAPGDEPAENNYEKEQWDMQLHQYADRCPDTHMPTSMVAIVNLLTENVHKLGLNAAQTLNRKVRDNLYNAGMSGWTVASALTSSGTTIHVTRLNGFTRARRPDLSAGEPVQFATVSATNPLQIQYKNGGTVYNATVTGYTPTYSGDETGPGDLTVLETVTLAARDPIWSSDHSYMVRPSDVFTVDGLTGASSFGMTYSLFRKAVARLEDSNVPKMPDGYYHVHMNSYSKGQLFDSDESQKLLTSLPDHYWFKQFTQGEVLGGLIFNDTECPRSSNVRGGSANTYAGGGRAAKGERFGGELWNTIGGVKGLEIQRPIFIGAEAIYEYYNDLSGLLTEAGVNGVVGEFQPAKLTNNGVEINADRVQVFMRAPVNVMGDVVTSIWKSIMDWPTRTDATTGDSARYKRVVVAEHV
jgi:hypothetical protein